MREKNKLIVYIAAVIVPVIILIAMTLVPLLTMFFGEEILLETRPVDPRDLFRGDYVNLSFAIQDVDKSLFPEQLKNRKTFYDYKNKDLYAILKKTDEYYEIDHMSFTKPDDQYYLQAKVRLYRPLDEENRHESIYVEYQIDRYFIPENTGKALEEMSRKGELVAKVKVWHGYPLLQELFPK